MSMNNTKAGGAHKTLGFHRQVRYLPTCLQVALLRVRWY